MKIVFSNGPGEGKEMEFALQEITVGREMGNILRIPAGGVSRFHAKIFRSEEGVWWIQDQNSTNGVKVNRSRICGEEELKEGDEITIGEQTLRVFDLNGAAPKVVFRPIISPPTGEIPISGEGTGFGAAPGTTVIDPVDDEPVVKFDAQKVKRAILGGNIFSGRNRAAAEEPLDPSERGRRRFSLLFYSVIGICALVVILTVLSRPAPAAKKSSAPQVDNSSIRFEKVIFQKNNIFRFSASLEGDTVEFAIDDIKSRRHFTRKIENPQGMEILRSNIRDTGIAKCPSRCGQWTDDTIRRRILLADQREVCEIEAWGEYPPEPVERVENYIRDFAEIHGLQTISLTPEELKRQAEESFNKAEDLFNNREADLQNLRGAILRYRLVIVALEQFAQPPRMLKVAREHLAEAERIRKHKMSQFRYEESRLLNMEDVHGLRRIYTQEMELADLNSPDHDRARQRLFILDRNSGKVRK